MFFVLFCVCVCACVLVGICELRVFLVFVGVGGFCCLSGFGCTV